MSEYKIKTINGKQIPEHRAVIEELLDIKLNKSQVVHHIKQLINLNGEYTLFLVLNKLMVL